MRHSHDENFIAELAASFRSYDFDGMLVGPPGSGTLEGAVRQVRNFGPVQRGEVSLQSGETIKIDAPRGKALRAGDTVGLPPRPYPCLQGWVPVRGRSNFHKIHLSATVPMQQRPFILGA